MSVEDTKSNGKRKGNEKKTGTLMVILIGVGVLVFLALIIIAILLIKGNRSEEVEVTSTNRNVIVTPDNIDEITSQIADWEVVPAGYFNTRMCMEWHFNDGSAVSDNAYVKNDKANTNDVYFDVFLADDESSPILESPVIPIGSEMTQIALDTPLEAGEYKCVIVYHLIDNEQNTIGTLRVGFTVIIDS